MFFSRKIKDLNDHLKKIIDFFKGKSKISAIHLRKSFVFHMKIKDFKDHVKKIIVFSKGNQRFQPDC
jgi:hypothetical protein